MICRLKACVIVSIEDATDLIRANNESISRIFNAYYNAGLQPAISISIYLGRCPRLLYYAPSALYQKANGYEEAQTKFTDYLRKKMPGLPSEAMSEIHADMRLSKYFEEPHALLKWTIPKNQLLVIDQMLKAQK